MRPPTDWQIEAIIAALNAALAGSGFDGGDFDGMNPDDFQTALDWAEGEREQRRKRAKRKKRT